MKVYDPILCMVVDKSEVKKKTRDAASLSEQSYAKIEKAFQNVFAAINSSGVNQYVAAYAKDKCTEAMRKLYSEVK